MLDSRFFNATRALGHAVCTRSEPTVKMWPLIEAVFAPIARTDTSTIASNIKIERALGGTHIAVPSGSNVERCPDQIEKSLRGKKKKAHKSRCWRQLFHFAKIRTSRPTKTIII
jgi:hypothetical protein